MAAGTVDGDSNSRNQQKNSVEVFISSLSSTFFTHFPVFVCSVCANPSYFIMDHSIMNLSIMGLNAEFVWVRDEYLYINGSLYNLL